MAKKYQRQKVLSALQWHSNEAMSNILQLNKPLIKKKQTTNTKQNLQHSECFLPSCCNAELSCSFVSVSWSDNDAGCKKNNDIVYSQF